MDMKNSNKMFGWVQANDAGDTGRPRCLSCPLRSCYMRAAWLAVSWWMMGIEFWRSLVKVWIPAVSHTLTPRDAQLCQPHHPCQFISTICPCPPPPLTQSLVKTSQDGSPRWLCMTTMAEGAAGRCAGLLCRSGNHPGRSRLALYHPAIPTPSQLWDKDAAGCSPHFHQTEASAVGDLKFKLWISSEGWQLRARCALAAVYLFLFLLVNY